MTRTSRLALVALLLLVPALVVLAGAPMAHAQADVPLAGPAGAGLSLPTLRLDPAPTATRSEQVTSLQLLMLLTVLSVAPAVLILMTAFTRVVVVLSFVRTSLGTPSLPPNQVLMGLALFLTFFIMSPVFTQVQKEAWVPYTEGRMTQSEAIDTAMQPMRVFMMKQTRKQDLDLMVQLAATPRPAGPEEVSALTLIPAFAISELRTSFQMGFMLFLPFVVIDLVVASTMMSMGMMMVPPAMVSLPFKVLVFVLADGWHLVVRSLAMSFR